jgi:hypothetical protein
LIKEEYVAFITNTFGKNRYRCDGCGKEDWWGESWGSYGSIVLAETSPHDLLTSCSPECEVVVMKKIRSGEYVLPKLKKASDGIHHDVIEDRRGY